MRQLPTKRIFIAAALACSCLAGANAQTGPKLPSASQLEQEQARIEAQRRQVFDPNNPATQGQKAHMPNKASIEGEMRRIEDERKQMFSPGNEATRHAPNTFPNIPTPKAGQVDLEALARRYEQKAQARQADGLLVFASFTMPKESLKRLVRDAARAGGVVVMRGFKNGSIKATGLAMNELGVATSHVQVNPNAFTKYRVGAVPAVVLVKAETSEAVDAEGCALPDHYAMVAGDVGLLYSLEHLEIGAPQFREMAQRYARPLKGTVQ